MIGFDNRIHRSGFECIFRFFLIPGCSPLQGIVGPDQPRKPGGSSKTRQKSEFDLGQSHLGLGRCNPEGGSQCDFKAASQSIAVDGTDTWNAQIFHVQEDLLLELDLFRQFIEGHLEKTKEFSNVRPDDEGFLGTVDQQSL